MEITIAEKYICTKHHFSIKVPVLCKSVDFLQRLEIKFKITSYSDCKVPYATNLLYQFTLCAKSSGWPPSLLMHCRQR